MTEVLYEPFRREQRYIVFKMKELAKVGLTFEERCALNSLANKIHALQKEGERPPIECLVIEPDWRCYNEAWALVEREYNEDQEAKNGDTGVEGKG